MNNLYKEQVDPCSFFLSDHPVAEKFRESSCKVQYKYFLPYKNAIMAVREDLRARSIWINARGEWIKIRRRNGGRSICICAHMNNFMEFIDNESELAEAVIRKITKPVK